MSLFGIRYFKNIPVFFLNFIPLIFILYIMIFQRFSKFSLLLVFCLFVQHSIAQTAVRSYGSIRVIDDKIEVVVSDGRYEIAPLNDFIFHTTFYPENTETKDFSFAADLQPKKVEYTITEEGNNISIKSKGINVRITKAPFSLAYFYNDKLLISELRGFVPTDTLQRLNFAIDQDEILYGGGARVLGMDRRGNRLKMYNRAHYGYETHSELMNFTLPLFISSKQYAVLFDNASLGYLDLDSKAMNEVTYETIGGTPNYYVIAGKDWYHLVKQYTLLTGRQPLPPRWAFGNFSSRFGYHSQAETEATVKKFLKDGIPLDAVIIDIYWFGKEIQGAMGNLDWYRDSFPNPERMMKRFEKMGVKTILVTEPFILTTSDRWKEAVDKKVLGTDSLGNPYTYDFYFGNTGLIDIYKPEARAWFWNIYKDLTKQGVGGWWGDLGEPEVHPADLQHVIGSADEVHNSYGHEWAKVIYEGYRKDFPDQRPFILMRAGYAGSQRYGMIPWTGDVSRSWGGLVPQPELSLQMGMQGLAYMHSDLGGFAGGDTIDNELYTRWLQYGVFQPIFRPHAQEHIPAEPVFHNEVTKARAKKSIELRYKLLPYIYNLAFENRVSGKPLMIPLFFNEPDNPSLLTYDSAYMWGDAFLVSPVKSPGLKNQHFYLPKGTTWTDFYTGEIHNGGVSITMPLTIDHIPVLVKGGSFIPMSQKATNTASYSLRSFDLHYFADTLVPKSQYSLYNDDGETPDAYLKGKYEMMEFKAVESADSLVIELQLTKSLHTFNKTGSDVNLIIHNLNHKPSGLNINGAEAASSNWFWNEEDHTIHIKTNCPGHSEKIEIFR
jgi:alpha-glucosidase (family GH31 glycosyl hydrolase)